MTSGVPLPNLAYLAVTVLEILQDKHLTFGVEPDTVGSKYVDKE